MRGAPGHRHSCGCRQRGGPTAALSTRRGDREFRVALRTKPRLRSASSGAAAVSLRWRRFAPARYTTQLAWGHRWGSTVARALQLRGLWMTQDDIRALSKTEYVNLQVRWH